jgi:hypothetical protein
MSTPDQGAGSGSSPTEAPWYQGAVGWLPLSRAFIDRELVKPNPDYRSLADRLAPYSPAERHAGWIGIAQSAPSRMARTRAYVEALHNDPDPTSVAWSWLDGDFDLMERVEHVLSPDDEHTPATVEALRNRVGSILDVGGADMPVPDVETATEAEPAGVPDVEQLAAAEAAALSEAERTAELSSGAEAEEPAGAAETSSGTVSPAAGGVTAADEAWAGLTADPEATAQPAAEPAAAAPQATQPVAASVQAVQPGATALWVPTHFVPAGGMSAWDYPDPFRPPRVVLNAGLGLVIDGIAGDWALVRAVNGWRGWADGRRLAKRP